MEGLLEIYFSNCTADEWEIITVYNQMNEGTDGGMWLLDACRLSCQLLRKEDPEEQTSRDTPLPLLSPGLVPRSLLSMQIQEINNDKGLSVDIGRHSPLNTF